MSDYPMLISNKLHSFRNFALTKLRHFEYAPTFAALFFMLYTSFLFSQHIKVSA